MNLCSTKGRWWTYALMIVVINVRFLEVASRAAAAAAAAAVVQTHS